VCEGRWSKGTAFDSDRILIKHGNEYKPPKVDTSGPRS
jgi:cytochrome c-type biogenesis protein CcmE